ncbi:cell wall-binding repeat-containing protein [Terrimesophilobacter mesophilus]|uniref:cell wall-binding repeat-containing protein n=1 Tax=Terrimesophilobacter mesophilus TaxID=433647 RepID=UPI001425A80B|nr:cell wall-binding repeat-containing protein [Terrimesophilobacter mesophilus]
MAAGTIILGGAPTVSIADTTSTITLSGHISLGSPGVSAGLNEVGVAYRVWQPQWFTSSDLVKTDTSGDFHITVSAPAILALNFDYLGSGNFVDGTTSSSLDPSDPALNYSVDTTGIDITLLPGASISGNITDSAGVPQLDVTAVAVRSGSISGERPYSANSDAAGNYTITGLPAGDYRVQFRDDRMAGTGPDSQKFFDQWWQSNAMNLSGAPPMTIATGQSVTDVDIGMVRPGLEEYRISCLYCDAQLAWNTPVYSRLERQTAPEQWSTISTQQTYLPTVYGQFRNLYPGTYRLRLKVDNARYQETLTPAFTLLEGASHLDSVDVPTSVNDLGSISGHVALMSGPASVTVGAYLDSPDGLSGSLEGETTVDPNSGNYLITGLPSGDYRVQFSTTTVGYANEWWVDAWTRADAARVILETNQIVEHIDASLSADGPPPSMNRIAGMDRFETSAKIAQSFTATGGVVYVANGGGYPDALSAAAAAARWNAPLLLTARDYLPSPVRTQLLRLKPSRIVVVGGTGVVSTAVFNELSALSANPPERIAGPDRFATSRAIAEDAFLSLGNAYVIIATGRSFPDALSAASAANQIHAPVILVDGGLDHLDDSTKSLLLSFPYLDKVYIAGGTGVVSAGIQRDIDSLGIPKPTARLGGADRYETSALIAHAFFGGPSQAFFATGTGFADALSGAPLAAFNSAPLYLVRPNCVPPVVLDELAPFRIERITLLGGTGVLTSRVNDLAACSP